MSINILDLMAEIAEMSEGGNATVPLENLTDIQRRAVEQLISLSGIQSSGDIILGKIAEVTLRVIKNTARTLVTVIMPIDEFGRTTKI